MQTSAVYSRHDTEVLAFQLWQQRGEPWGTPEVDWFQAEEKLKATGAEPALSTVAKTIGAALGSVAAMLTPDN